MSNSGREAAMTWIDQLETEAATWVTVLVREEVSRTLHRSDLDKLMELIEASAVSNHDSCCFVN